MTVLETREEWACIEHWLETAYFGAEPYFQRIAISKSICMVLGLGVDHLGQWVDGDIDYMWGICEKY